jgi:chromate transport protein ChrA
MLIRLMILAVAVLLVSLLFGLHRRLKSAPPWLRLLHHTVFSVALAYAATFTAIFLGLHLFGYQI